MSDAMLVRLEDGRIPNRTAGAGYEYFLEVDVIRDEVLGDWAPQLDSTERVDLIIHYAEHDAWPEWFNAFCLANRTRLTGI